MKSKICLALLILISFNFSFLQAQTFDRFPVDFVVEGNELQNPLTGGLNGPQFSELDLNNDGILDLYIFDRAGNVHLTFLNEGTANQSNYTYAPEYLENFPFCVNWVNIRDFNGDGAYDIFTSGTNEGIQGIRVFLGKFTDGKLDFDRVQLDNDFDFNVLTFPTSNGDPTQIYVANIDYADFNDIDFDGDMDILNFNSNGGHIYFYKNISDELGFGKDSLIFKLIDNCWGRLFEADMSEAITLGADINDCPNGFVGPPKDRHQGSTLLSFDEDGDNDREIVIGDIANEYLFKLTNGGDEEVAFMIDQDNEFPDYDSSVVIPFFPAAFHLDLNNDGLKDFVASPNVASAAPDHDVVRFYKNVGDTEDVVFEFQQGDFLVDQMLDFGTMAYPVFEDVNGDSLLDLVVGNFTFFREDGNFDPYVALFLNIGTKEEPKFELIDNNWLNINALAADIINGYWGLAPTFGDLDGDEDKDLLIGAANGKLLYLENKAGKGNPMEFEDPIQFWQNIDIGQNVTPQIMDMNRDGLNDLVLGERRGKMVYFPNIGTQTNPMFHSNHNEAPNIKPFGNVELVNIVGNISPEILDYGNDFKIVMGWETGRLHLFENIENNLDGDFLLSDSNFGKVFQGKQTSPALADLNDDGLLEMAVGNFRGGLSFFKTELEAEIEVSTKEEIPKPTVHIFPNPTNGNLTISAHNINPNSTKCLIFNALGQLIHIQNLKETTTSIDLKNISAGIYFCKIESYNGSTVKRFVVK